MSSNFVDFEKEILPQLDIQREYEELGVKILKSTDPSKRISIENPYDKNSSFKAFTVTEEGPYKGNFYYKQKGGKLYERSFIDFAADFFPGAGGSKKCVYEHYIQKVVKPPTAAGPKATPKINNNYTDSIVDFNGNVNTLIDVIKSHGWEINEIILDGNYHRFDTNKAGDKAGRYFAFHDGDFICCNFGSFKEGRQHTWSNRNETRTEEESTLFKKQMEKAKQKRLEEQEKTKQRAQGMWDHAKPAPDDHPYLIKKGVKSNGLRIWKKFLVVPVYVDNVITSLQLKIQEKKKQIENLKERIRDVNHELKRITENTDRLIEERDRFISGASKEKQENSFASVMYITTVQQNIAYINNLRSSINDLNKQILQELLGVEQLETQLKDMGLEKSKLEQTVAYQVKDLGMDIRDNQNEMKSLKKGLELEIGNVESEIKALEIEGDSLNEEIKQLELKRSDTENIQIRKRPTAGVDPVKPKIKLNILLSLIIGLFLSVFLAFFLEALAKRRSGKHQ